MCRYRAWKMLITQSLLLCYRPESMLTYIMSQGKIIEDMAVHDQYSRILTPEAPPTDEQEVGSSAHSLWTRLLPFPGFSTLFTSLPHGFRRWRPC